MPSIEVICVDQATPTNFKSLSFAIVSGQSLKSHRRPSRFQPDFDLLNGCIYHFGNPRLRDPAATGAFFAYDLLSRAAQDDDQARLLEFESLHKPGIALVLSELLRNSPSGRLLFTSDWQFGLDEATRNDPISLDEFWKRHDAKRLVMNAAYPIQDAEG